MDVTGHSSKAQSCKEQYCTGTWNVKSMTQGRNEMARVNINILGISELIWTAMGKFNFDDQYIFYCAQEPLEEMG